MIKKQFITTTLAAMALSTSALSTAVLADVSATATLVSDYTFNGISQTDEGPALQGSLTYSNDSGWYLGAWGSNVDFHDDTDIEIDVYTGKYVQLNEAVGLDTGIAYYAYFGGNSLSDLNYAEVFTKFNLASDYGTSELNLWYAWDYAGTDAGNAIVMLAHSIEISEGHTLRFNIDQSTSLDDDKFAWDGDDDSYIHFRAAYQTSFKGFDFELSAEDTTIDGQLSDARIVAGISRSFSF